MRYITFVFCAALSASLMGCTQFPALDGAITEHARNAKYPKLVPVETLLARTAPSAVSSEQTVAGLSVRVAALQNRATQMRGSIIDADTRRRMQNGVR